MNTEKLKSDVENCLSKDEYKKICTFKPLPEFSLIIESVCNKFSKNLPDNYRDLSIKMSMYGKHIRYDGGYKTGEKVFRYYFCTSFSPKTQKLTHVNDSSSFWDDTPPPPKSIDDFIIDIKAIDKQKLWDSGNDNYLVYQTCEGVDENDPRFPEAIPVIFELFERLPDEDIGSPGAFVHMIEAVGGYEEMLVSSLKRMPSIMGMLMMNRILNGEMDDKKREEYSTVFLSILKNEKVNNDVKDVANSFAESLIERGKIDENLYKEYM